jgi:hypothetical protein
MLRTMDPLHALAMDTELTTLDIVPVASDIADAGTALAGLILVYLGAVAVRYETLFPKTNPPREIFIVDTRGEPSAA